MYSKLISLFLFTAILFAGGYDHGKSAGKGNWNISLTWNPFSYFDQGQSYALLGYGLTERLDIHGYYSYTHERDDNYYIGLLYQFYSSSQLDLSTALGIRKYTKEKTTHLFVPQILYRYMINERVSLGGSFVDIRSQNMQVRKGVATDVFLMIEVYEKKNYKIDISVGGFSPVLWEPNYGNWYPTYSLDITIK